MKNKKVESYIIGFFLSVFLTLLAYFVVTAAVFSGWLLTGTILFLAFLQLLVQLIFFLHLLEEAKPRWNLVIFIWTVSIILTVVLGSLWIMKNLNYHMTPAQINNYLQNQGGF